MKRPTMVLLALLTLGLPAAHADNPELVRLAAQDQTARMGGEAPEGSDDARRTRVLQILASGGVDSPRDKFNAALVLQHTGMTFCEGRLVSLSAENYLLAHYLFNEAVRDGLEEAKYLAAASMDRYLSVTKGYQRYGTNRVIDQDTGKEMLVPIDRTTTDEERQSYGVPPLEALLKQWPEQVVPGGEAACADDGRAPPCPAASERTRTP